MALTSTIGRKNGRRNIYLISLKVSFMLKYFVIIFLSLFITLSFFSCYLSFLLFFFSFVFSLTLSISLSLSLSHTHTHTHTHSLSLSHTHTHSLSLPPFSDGYVYWSDTLEDTIYRANLSTGLDQEAIVTTNIPEPGIQSQHSYVYTEHREECIIKDR